MSKIKDYAEQVFGEDWECALEDYLCQRHIERRG